MAFLNKEKLLILYCFKMLKEEIRKIYKQKREELNPEEYQKRSQSVHDVLFSRIMMHRFSPIHVFTHIKRKKEPDTSLIINTLRKNFAPDMFISKVVETELYHVPFLQETPLKTNKWGIAEPDISQGLLSSEDFFKKYAEEDILVLVPLLAFDKNGNRVGYGKGFYDGFLKYASSNTTIIGLSLFEALEELISDVSVTDIKLNFCITPGKVWTF
jgi:5-formyltetrahydrofolate cyclo-ligase